MYVNEIKCVRRITLAKHSKNAGGKMQGCPTMLMKTNGENMSENGLATMLMKTNDLWGACHDVDDKNAVIGNHG